MKLLQTEMTSRPITRSASLPARPTCVYGGLNWKRQEPYTRPTSDTCCINSRNALNTPGGSLHPAALGSNRRQLCVAGTFPLAGTMKSAEQILEEPVARPLRTTAEECPFCVDAPVKENGKKCVGVCRNPQNVPGPLVFPHEMQTAEDAVRLQLNAIRDNNVPRANHGVQVLYEFAVEAGTMERAHYFGWSTDLYHFDHFMGKALNTFGDMIDSQSYEIMPAEVTADGRTRVRAVVESIVGEKSEWVFVMVMRTFSKYKGCWATHRLIRSDSKYLDQV